MCNYNFCFNILFSKMPHEVPDLKYCFKLVSEAAEMVVYGSGKTSVLGCIYLGDLPHSGNVSV